MGALSRSSLGYWACLKYEFGGPRGAPAARPHNAVLRTNREWQDAIQELKALGLPPNPLPQKNWDTLIALDHVLRTTTPSARVLDAGASLAAVLLPHLFLYGYRDLVGANIAFHHPRHRGSIRYEPGDITRTGYADGSFDIAVCLSVIEHGVDVRGFLKEMARVVKPGGTLFISTDYYEPAPDTAGLVVCDAPWHIFAERDVRQLVEWAGPLGLRPTAELDLDCGERTVTHRGRSYTFLTLALRNDGRPA